MIYPLDNSDVISPTQRGLVIYPTICRDHPCRVVDLQMWMMMTAYHVARHMPNITSGLKAATEDVADPVILFGRPPDIMRGTSSICNRDRIVGLGQRRRSSM